MIQTYRDLFTLRKDRQGCGESLPALGLRAVSESHISVSSVRKGQSLLVLQISLQPGGEAELEGLNLLPVGEVQEVRAAEQDQTQQDVFSSVFRPAT